MKVECGSKRQRGLGDVLLSYVYCFSNIASEDRFAVDGAVENEPEYAGAPGGY